MNAQIQIGDQDGVELALEDEIREILSQADDTLSVAEIFARSALAEGRHSVATRLASMAKRGLVVTHPCSAGRCYSLPEFAKAQADAQPTTIKGRVRAHLVRMGQPVSLRQIAEHLQLDRKAVTRALNALGREGLADKSPLDSHGRMAWRAIEVATSEAATPKAPTLGELVGRLRDAWGMPASHDDTPAEPLFALASDGSLTLCVDETELLLDADETEALLDYLAPFIQHRQARQAEEAA